jgi:hypothetical protein
MKPLPHRYEVRLHGSAASRIAFTTLDLDVDGTVDWKDGVSRFTEIVLRARLTIPIRLVPEIVEDA